MNTHILVVASQVLSAIFAIIGLAYLVAPRLLREVHDGWGHSPVAVRVLGLLNLVTAAFLALPPTRIWGVALGAFIAFGAVVTLFNHHRYVHAIPSIMLLLALPLALAAGPF